ncbi:MAG: hypothetical protein H7Z40_17515 [Phycisphaerae bacterium]|nr:hypothetical protein [Gemmatimonadaceae bacterium]
MVVAIGSISARRFAVAVVVALGAFSGAADARAWGQQVRTSATPDTTDPLARAMSAEDRGDVKAAAAAYRQVLARALSAAVNDGDQASMALLGLERVWTEAGMQDSIMPVVERVLLVRRTDPIARGIQLRLSLAAGHDEAARTAFNEWRRAVPTEAGPYREYARQLMSSGRAKSADTVLTDAARMLGNARDLSGEVAQLNISLERWVPAAVAFKTALAEQPWLEHAAIYALQRVPAAKRDSVRDVMLSAPVTLIPRRLLSEVEMAWGEPRRAWAALAPVKSDDSTTAAWRMFAEQAEAFGAWLIARDAWTAVMDKSGDLSSVQRAAHSAIQGGDAASALTILARGSNNRTGAAVTKALLPVEIAALSELGRPADAQKRIEESKQFLDDGMRADLLKPLIGAWLRSGNLEQARVAAANADLSDDDETAGWLALYSGDLVTARKRLVRVAARRGAQIEALAVLSRTKAISSPELGAAFLTVARRDTSLAVTQFVTLAQTMHDAAPALLATAARLEEARRNPAASTRALVLWKRLRAEFPKSPEAPEAVLSWAQSLARTGDYKGAVEQMEVLLVDYSDSALAPQARRELITLRGKIPPGGY